MQRHHAITTGVFVAIAIGVGTVLFVSRDTAKPEWVAARDIIRPQLTAETLPVVQRPFSPGIYIALVLHHGDQYVFINDADLEVFGVTAEEAWEQALDNLDAASTDIELQVFEADGGGKYAIIESGDGYDAARILLPSVRANVADQLGEPYIGAVPTRDFLIFWQADFPLYKKFLDQVKVEFGNGGDHALSPELFRFEGDKVEVSEITP
jgi:uncharacterized protein YtpQ (UPF0354 family)